MGYDMSIVNEDPAERAEVAAATERFNQACKKRDALPAEWKGEFTEAEFEALSAAGKFPPDEHPANRHPEWREAQNEVELAYAAMRAAEKSYFRLNIFGMPKVVDIMVELDAARALYARREDWPSLGPWMREGQEAPVDMDHWYQDWRSEPNWRDSDYQEPTGEVLQAFKKHQKAIAAFKAWSPTPDFPDDHRIPVHKFGSNDGWLVTEEECAYAAKVLTEAREKDGAGYVATLARHGWGSDEARRYFDQWIDFLATASKRGGFEVW